MILALAPLIEFVFKVLMYYGAMKMRNLDARWMTASMCAGSTVVATLLPFPMLIQLAITIAVAAFFLTKHAEAELYPDGVGIPLGVEVISAFALQFVVFPLIETL